MTREELIRKYTERRDSLLVPMARHLEDHLRSTVERYPRIDRIVARAKSVDRFLEKGEKVEDGKLKYDDPLNQIQDQIGARIVTYYLEDVERLCQTVSDYYSPIEAVSIVPDSPKEFGYEGKHFILLIPDDLILSNFDRGFEPRVFELQVKTVFQHAWGEAEHDLGYKPTTTIAPSHRKMMAFTAAQAWGADKIFQEVAQELGKFN